MKLETRGTIEMKKTKDRSEDIWCDKCDDFVGRDFEIDSEQRLVCLKCVENAENNRIYAGARRKREHVAEVFQLTEAPVGG